MTITEIDRRCSEAIRRKGKSTYAFWEFIAAQAFWAYAVIAVLAALLGRFPFLHAVIMGFGTYIMVLVIQVVIRRSRPNFEQNTGYHMWWKTYSMPSGHAALSAVSAFGLILFTNISSGSVAVAYACFLLFLAVMISISRIIVGVHYFSDVIFGFLLGTMIAFLYAQTILT